MSREKMDKRLRESNERYRSLIDDVLDSSRVGIFILDSNFKIVWVNHALESYFGLRRDNIIGKDKRQLIHEQIKDEFEDSEGFVKKVLSTYDNNVYVENFECHILPGSGRQERWLEHWSQPIQSGLYAGGRVEHYTDITERKRREEEIRREKERSEAYLNIAGVMLAIIDADENISLINNKGCEILGYKVEELMGRNWFDTLVPQRIKGEIKGVFAKVMAGDIAPVEYYENTLLTRDGEEKTIAFHNTVIRNPGGQISGALLSGEDITERKEIEGAILESEEKYRDLYANAPTTYFSVGLDGFIKESNKAAQYFMGYSEDELRRISVLDLYAEESKTKAKSLFDNRFKQGLDIVNEEMSYLRKNGKKVYGSLSVSQMKDKDGQVVASRSIVRDITERKKAEEALKVKDNAIASSINAIAFTDLKGNLTYVNSSFLRMWRYADEKEVLGKPAVQFWQIKKKAQKVVRALRNIGEWKGELTATRKDGSNFDVELSINMLTAEDGKPLCMIGSFVDITQRKEAEEELRSSEERLSTIFEHAPDGLYLADLKGVLIAINKTAEEITGYRKDELIGKSFLKLKLLPAGQIPKAAALFAKNILGQPTGPDEFTLNRKDGTKVQVEIRTHFTKIAGKTSALAIMHDITQRKKMEEEKTELEQKAQLASRLATVGEMASGIAHEINNPLTGVIGFSQLLAQREDMPEDIKEKLGIIAEGSQRVAGIVSRLLAFARQHKLERSYVDINELLENTLKLRAYTMHTSDIKLSTHLDSALPRTMADGAQLQQVFLNLIINAETEMKKAHGKGKLLVKTEAIDDTIRISFKDDGPGIAPENLDRLFEPFFTTREVGEGTGLGLSICHGIIAEHHGQIYARSGPGKGATFIVELPVFIEEKQLELARTPVDESRKVTGAKILVVDDEPTNLQLLTHLLSREGYDVESTGDAETALEKIKSQRYNLILLDIKLPGLSGIELYENMQKIAQSLASRVLFITGDAMAADTMSFLSRAKVPYITKPFDIKKLKRTVSRMLAQS